MRSRPAGTFLEDRLEASLRTSRLSEADRHLCQELVFGVTRWQATLDWLIARKTSQRPAKAALRDLLRLGLFQIFWLDRIPAHAAVYETVEPARRRAGPAQAAFVNALLRGYLRELEATRLLLKDLKKTDPPLGFSHPKWLVERWQRRWGPDRAAQLMDWNNTPPRNFARVNTLKITPEQLLLQWREEGVNYDRFRRDWFEENLVFEMKSHPRLDRLPSFQAGYFYVQDPSTLLAVQEMAPSAGEHLLDLCAAPGGKLTCLAQRMHNQGRLVAHDLSDERLELVRTNCRRLGVTCVETTLRLPESADFSGFDRVLLDAPCSNTGVMRRRVELRWRIRPEEIERLRALQMELLEKGARLLKPGGSLVYSTCSLEPEENEQLITAFLADHPSFELARQRELLPFTDSVDGAFVVKLRRRK